MEYLNEKHFVSIANSFKQGEIVLKIDRRVVIRIDVSGNEFLYMFKPLEVHYVNMEKNRILHSNNVEVFEVTKTIDWMDCQ